MKTRIVLFIVLLLFSCSYAISIDAKSGENRVPENSINVFTTPDLLQLTQQWASEYSNKNPKITINITEATGNEVADRILTGGESGFISSENYPRQISSVWNITVGRDVIVAVMNAENPLLDEIYQRGFSKAELVQIFSDPENPNWTLFFGNSQNIPLHLYVANDPSILSGINEYLNINPSETSGIPAANVQEMISAMQKDPNAIGFCKLIQIIDPANQSLLSGLKLVPIDGNGNGKLDNMENIYENLQSFTRGVWIGKYPKELSAKIYLVTSEKLNNPDEVAFLKWILTDGQQSLNQNGYSDLFYSEQLSQLAKFDVETDYAALPVKKANTFMALLLFILFFMVMAVVVLDLIFRRFRTRNRTESGTTNYAESALDTESIAIPKGLYFDKTHTWAFRKKNGLVKIGMDDFMQHVTGLITRIETKKTGEQIRKGEFLFSIIQKGKLLNIYSPISGTIKQVNKNLITNASLLNMAPYTQGWVYLVEPLNWELELQFLMQADKFKIDLLSEFTRLKDFFASVFKPHSLEYAHAVLQDGGALKDHVLADLGPEVWEDFQTRFIDTSRQTLIDTK